MCSIDRKILNVVILVACNVVNIMVSLFKKCDWKSRCFLSILHDFTGDICAPGRMRIEMDPVLLVLCSKSIPAAHGNIVDKHGAGVAIKERA